MSLQVVNLTERQLKFGIVRLAMSLVALILLVAFVTSLLADRGQQIAISALFVALSFSLLANGLLAILKIIDWFEAWKHRHG